jgi:putative oxidoreductase
MSFWEHVSPLIGRWVFAWFFLGEVGHYGGDWSGTISLLNFAGVPAAPFVLALGLILTVLGSLSLIFGFQTRHGAMLLFAITMATAVIIHDYWTIGSNPMARAADFQLFACYVAIAGGLLVLVGMGPGPFAADNRMAPKKK